MTPTQIVDALQSGAFEDVASAATPSFRPQLREQLPSVWRSLVDRCGPVDLAPEQAYPHDLALVGPHGSAHLQVAYRGDVISGLILRPGAPTGRFNEPSAARTRSSALDSSRWPTWVVVLVVTLCLLADVSALVGREWGRLALFLLSQAVAFPQLLSQRRARS